MSVAPSEPKNFRLVHLTPGINRNGTHWSLLFVVVVVEKHYLPISPMVSCTHHTVLETRKRSRDRERVEREREREREREIFEKKYISI